jgi:hypothetical protein
MDINKIKDYEIEEIKDFISFIRDYGHIFYGKETELDSSFNKIIEGINEIKNIVDNYYSY